MRFEWDSAKADRNIETHGVTFEEAATVFTDPNCLPLRDFENAQAEARMDVIGFPAKCACCTSWPLKSKMTSWGVS
jgi:uncharacterized DUF497 family protein